MTGAPVLPLTGTRVIELGRVYAAPWSGLMLADMGADVIKLEEPRGGDMMRGTGPGFALDGDGRPTADSGKFHALNRNKRSATVDITTPEGQEIVRALAAKADVFIENFKVGDLERRGLDYASLNKLNPGLIYVSITGFGQTGPYRKRPAFDAVAQAYSGFMSVNGEAGGPPLRSTVNVMDFTTAMFATVGIVGALLHRRNGGPGQHIDMSMVDSGLSMMSYPIMSAWLAGAQPPRTGSSNVDWVPSGNFACADGLIYIVCGTDRDFARFSEAIGRPELADDPRFATRALRNDHKTVVDDILAEVLPRETMVYWVERFDACGVVAAPVYEFADIMRDPQVAARGTVTRVPTAAGGEVPLIRNPIRYSAMADFPERAAPLLGQHTDEILREELGYDASRIATLRRTGVI